MKWVRHVKYINKSKDWLLAPQRKWTLNDPNQPLHPNFPQVDFMEVQHR